MRDLPKRGVGETKTECVCLQSAWPKRVPALYGTTTKHATSSHYLTHLRRYPNTGCDALQKLVTARGLPGLEYYFFEDKATTVTGRGYDSLLQSLLLLHLYWEKMT